MPRYVVKYGQRSQVCELTWQEADALINEGAFMLELSLWAADDKGNRLGDELTEVSAAMMLKCLGFQVVGKDGK